MARDYLKSRGFDRDAAVRFQFGYVGEPDKGHEYLRGRLVIPYLTPAGPVDLKFRALDGAEPKYMYVAGTQQRLFNAQTLLTVEDTVLLTEGELDAAAAECMAGVPAVGYPGVNAWDSHTYFRRCFDGVEHVVVVADGDEVGRKAAQAVAKSLFGSRVAFMPDGHDSNSYLVEFGPEKFRELVGV